MKNNPIGILDSGVGGLSIVSAIHEQLPLESIIYVGDSSYVPYGEKMEAEIFFEERVKPSISFAQKYHLLGKEYCIFTLFIIRVMFNIKFCSVGREEAYLFINLAY